MMPLSKIIQQLDTLKLLCIISFILLFEIGYTSFLHTYLKMKYEEMLILKNSEQVMEERLDSYLDQCQIALLIHNHNPQLKEEESVRIASVIVKQSARLGFDPLFLASIMITESRCRPEIRSSRGAIGLMQIKLSTARYVADLNDYHIDPQISDLKDFEHNIQLSTLYLKHLVDKYHGDVNKGLIAYNIGETSLKRLIKNKSPLPTRYLNKINQHYKKMKPKLE